jgi:hypothetical protein
MSVAFTLIDEQRAHEVHATVDGNTVRVPASDVRDALGWKLEPRGLCRDTACIPVPSDPSFATAAGIDLAKLAAVLGRPLAVDGGERVAALAAAASDRGARLAALDAPDFRLPDLHGRVHSLAEHRGKKALLIAYASW